MDTIHNWPVSLRWNSYAIQGWPVHNPNIGLHPIAGQPAADEYNTRLASQSKMDTIHNWPVSQRWVNTRPASQSKMGIMQDWPVSQRWIQYTTGQSVKDGYNTQPAGQSTMRFIFNTGLASP